MGLSLTDKNKRIINVCASVMLVLLLATTIGGAVMTKKAKKETNRVSKEKEDVAKALNVARDSLNTAKGDLVDLQTVCFALKSNVDSLGNVVTARADSIAGLERDLQSCRNSGVQRSSSAGRVSAQSRQRNSNSNTVVISDTCCNNGVNVRLNSSTNSGDIIVNARTGSTSVVLENNSSNSGTIVVGNNNVVNVYNGALGPNDTLVRSANVSARDTGANARRSNDSIVCTVRWVQTMARVR